MIFLSACAYAEPKTALPIQTHLPTPKPACTSAPLPTEVTQTVYVSPNATFAVLYTIPQGGLPSDGVYVIEEIITCGRSYHLKTFGWPTFIGWSSDSRYAIFSVGNQYKHYWPIVFDTGQWGEIAIARPDGEPGCDLGPMRPCESRQIERLLYAPDRIVYRDGSVVNLPNP